MIMMIMIMIMIKIGCCTRCCVVPFEKIHLTILMRGFPIERKFVCFHQIESNSIRVIKRNRFDLRVSFVNAGVFCAFCEPKNIGSSLCC